MRRFFWSDFAKATCEKRLQEVWYHWRCIGKAHSGIVSHAPLAGTANDRYEPINVDHPREICVCQFHNCNSICLSGIHTPEVRRLLQASVVPNVIHCCSRATDFSRLWV